MDSTIQGFLQRMDGDLSSLRTVIKRFASSDANVDPTTGALRLSHRPKIGSEAYACVLYPGVGLDLIDRYEGIHRSRLSDYQDIPPYYRSLLTRLNGAFVFQMDLFGIPLSMAQDPPLLNRSVLQQLDVCTANEHWRMKYGVARSKFFFASGSHSSTENVGYFLAPDNQVEAYLAGKNKIGEWQDLGAFLFAEIEHAESRFLEYEQMMGVFGSRLN